MRGVGRLLIAGVLLGGCGAVPTAIPPAPFEAGRSFDPEQADRALEARAKEVLDRIEHPVDRASWQAAVPRLRERLRASLGLGRLGEARPRALRSAGLLVREGYTLEKLVYETVPGCEVPAHLYRPISDAPKHPAILFVPGHWWADSKTRPDFQAFCITMARKGFVVLTYDPFGQGERGISWRDHRRTELLVAGVAQQAIVDFESMVALEILRSRPDVDADRIGITGASGGGYNSWIMAALDPRIAVSVPVVGTSEFHEQIRVCRPLDWYTAKEHCHFVPGLLRYANNHEFLAMIAPRPVLVIAAHNDQSFPLPGIREVVEYGRTLYGAVGFPERLRYFEDEASGHGYQRAKREAAYGWFLRWLRNEGDGAPVPESPLEVPPWDAPDLRCFPPGQNRPAGPALNALAQSLLSVDKRAPHVYQHLAEALGLELPVRLTAGPKLDRSPCGWTMKDGVTIPATVLPPPGPWRGALLAVSDGPRAELSDHPAVRAAREAGFAVVTADLRTSARPGWAFAVSLLLGENYSGRQALDLIAGFRALRVLPELEGKPIALLARGPASSLAALYAAVLEPRVAGLATEGGFATYRSFVDRPRSTPASAALARPGEERTIPLDREIPHALVLFDALRRFDLPDLQASLAPRPLLAVGAIDGEFHPAGPGLSAEDVKTMLASLSEAPLSKRDPVNLSTLVPRGGMPARIHVIETYETDIEKRWWLAGTPDPERACRGTLANDFDDKMGDPARLYTAVIFNPVPGPPMGPRTRLAFRYRIAGSPRLKVQIYSLSKGYHRHLTLAGLPQQVWQEATVDLTQARRPDGSGGPLSADERIDDIQFYTDPAAELLIDDIVLFEAAEEGERLPFPRRAIFTAGFDTGRWPGRFETVSHGTWKAARSVAGETALVVGLRGRRTVPAGSRLRFRYFLKGTNHLFLGERRIDLRPDDWGLADVEAPAGAIDRIEFRLPSRAELTVDDVLLYEPGEQR